MRAVGIGLLIFTLAAVAWLAVMSICESLR